MTFGCEWDRYFLCYFPLGVSFTGLKINFVIIKKTPMLLEKSITCFKTEVVVADLEKPEN